jgi:hypothetical protein
MDNPGHTPSATRDLFLALGVEVNCEYRGDDRHVGNRPSVGLSTGDGDGLIGRGIVREP